MADPASTDNLAIGRGVMEIAEIVGGVPGAYVDMGNCPSVEVEPSLERLPHYSSRTGFRLKDKNPIIQTEYNVNFECDEMAASNLARLLMSNVATDFRIFAMQKTDQEYALRFTSDNPIGPNQVWNFWKVTLTPNGPVQLIGEEYMVMSYTAEGLADETNHPESPFFTVDYDAAYTEPGVSQSSASSESV